MLPPPFEREARARGKVPPTHHDSYRKLSTALGASITAMNSRDEHDTNYFTQSWCTREPPIAQEPHTHPRLLLPSSRIVKEQPIRLLLRKTPAMKKPEERRFTSSASLLTSGQSLFVLPPAPPALGGANRDRTGDLLLAKQALSQLSYGPGESLVGLDGFEPSTPALSRRCSNQLSYRPHGRQPRKGSPSQLRQTTDRWWALRQRSARLERR